MCILSMPVPCLPFAFVTVLNIGKNPFYFWDLTNSSDSDETFMIPTLKYPIILWFQYCEIWIILVMATLEQYY